MTQRAEEKRSQYHNLIIAKNVFPHIIDRLNSKQQQILTAENIFPQNKHTNANQIREIVLGIRKDREMLKISLIRLKKDWLNGFGSPLKESFPHAKRLEKQKKYEISSEFNFIHVSLLSFS